MNEHLSVKLSRHGHHGNNKKTDTMNKSKNTTAMISGEKKVKVTFIAENNVGEERSVSIRLDKDSEALKQLKKDWDDGMGYVALVDIMNDDEQRKYYGYETYFSPSQTQRLKDFLRVIYHIFYNYDLSLEIDE